jgi:hypothetical protein
MKKTAFFAFSIFFIFAMACDSSEEQTVDTPDEFYEETDYYIEPEGDMSEEGIPEISDESNEATDVRKENERLTAFAERVWKHWCRYPGGNEEFELDGQTHVLSYCRSDDNNWFQYLLLKDIDGEGKNYTRQAINRRTELPSELDDYYAFPSFTPETVKGIDLDNDGSEEILIGIHVTGKSTGATAPEDDYWDEFFYEVYDNFDGRIFYSQELTDTYNEMLNDWLVNAVATEEVSIVLSGLKGEFLPASMKNGELHWLKCGYRSAKIWLSGELCEVLFDEESGEVDLIPDLIEGNRKKGNYTMTCIERDPDGDGTIEITIEYLTKDGIRYLVKDKIYYYILAEDKEKVPVDTDGCED